MKVSDKIKAIKKSLQISDERLGGLLNVSGKAVAEWKKGLRKPMPVNIANIDSLYEQVVVK